MLTSKAKSSHEELSPLADRVELGRKGEELAAAYLRQTGYRIVASNFIVPVGRNRTGAIVNVELDLVAYDGPTLSFIEVKTRASDWFATPSANVGIRKQRQIARAARTYLHIFGLAGEPYRFDVVSIVWPTGEDSGNLQIELLRGFWSPEKFRKQTRLETYWD